MQRSAETLAALRKAIASYELHDRTGTTALGHACADAVLSGGLRNAALHEISSNDNIETLMTDVRMPEMNGYELARRALQAKPSLKVVLMSGSDDGYVGFRFLREPFSQNELRDAVGFCG